LPYNDAATAAAAAAAAAAISSACSQEAFSGRVDRNNTPALGG